MSSTDKAVQCLQDLGDLGLVVSIVYGPMGNGQVCYSAQVMNRQGEGFELPYMAESFTQAVWVAAHESLKRKWI